jgi:hypothetical protein
MLVPLAHVRRKGIIPKGLLGDIRTAIADPDMEFAADNGHPYYYRRGLDGERFRRLWLFVVVWYQANEQGEQEGVIKTSYFTSRVARDGRITWSRSGL